MINERKFASQFSNFWRSTLPNLEATTRSFNLGYERFDGGVPSSSRADRRDLVSETGYRLFRLQVERPEMNELGRFEAALREVADFFQREIPDVGIMQFDLSASERLECTEISKWLARFVRSRCGGGTVEFPSFRGHGMLARCEGDFLVEGNLFEIKYVDRPFRSIDIRQVLIYCFLWFRERGSEVKQFYLVNPFTGCYFVSSPAEVIYSSAGMSSIEFYGLMSYALSSGEISR